MTKKDTMKTSIGKATSILTGIFVVLPVSSPNNNNIIILITLIILKLTPLIILIVLIVNNTNNTNNINDNNITIHHHSPYMTPELHRFSTIFVSFQRIPRNETPRDDPLRRSRWFDPHPSWLGLGFSGLPAKNVPNLDSLVWWLNQPIWKIWVKMGIIPPGIRGENKKYLKPPPRFACLAVGKI